MLHQIEDGGTNTGMVRRNGNVRMRLANVGMLWINGNDVIKVIFKESYHVMKYENFCEMFSYFVNIESESSFRNRRYFKRYSTVI